MTDQDRVLQRLSERDDDIVLEAKRGSGPWPDMNREEARSLPASMIRLAATTVAGQYKVLMPFQSSDGQWFYPEAK